jgi:hypothetical protein
MTFGRLVGSAQLTKTEASPIYWQHFNQLMVILTVNVLAIVKYGATELANAALE